MRPSSSLLVLLGLLPLLPAQLAFTETNRSYLPADRGFTFGLVAADFDGDGDKDLLVSNVSTPLRRTARLYRNDGGGRFQDVTLACIPQITVDTYGLAAGDVDGDGDLDVFLANSGPCRLWVNDGTGKFSDVSASHLPNHRGFHFSTKMRDVDNDGDVDILVGGEGEQVRLFQNDGSGKFADVTATHVPTLTSNTEDLDLFDVDKDGDLDLVLANYQQQPRLYQNDGSGRFTDATASRLPTGALATGAVAVVDIEADGDLDLVFGLWRTSHVVYVNDGSGVYSNQSATRMPTSTELCWKVRAADLDKDGDVDLVFANVSRSQIYRNDGSGVFTDASAATIDDDVDNCTDVVVADLDADGDLDLVFGDHGDLKQLWFNDGSGRFTAATQNRIPRGNWETRALGIGDVNGDGFADVVLGFGGFDRVPTELRLNDRLGGFVDASRTHVPTHVGADVRSLVVADVTGDGHLDVVRGVMNGQTTLWKNDGSGHFTDVTPANLPTANHATSAVVAADFDKDGDRDLLLVGHMSPSRLYQNDGTGKFTDVSSTGMPSRFWEARGAVTGDFDADGDIDVVVCCGSTALETARFLENDGTGKFVDASTTRMPPYPISASALVALDADKDGDLDLVLAGDGYSITGLDFLFLNDGAGHFSEAPYQNLPNGYERTTSVAAADVDGDGTTDLVFGDYDGPVRLFLGDGAGSFVPAPERMPFDVANCQSVALVDVDGDGDADAISCGAGIERSAAVVLVNHERQLHAPWLAKVGSAYVIECRARPGYATTNQSAFVFVAAGLLPTPITVAPFGKFRLDPGSLVSLGTVNIPVFGGLGQVSLAIPNQASLVGANFAAQALVLHSANPADARLTNALAERIVK